MGPEPCALPLVGAPFALPCDVRGSARWAPSRVRSRKCRFRIPAQASAEGASVTFSLPGRPTPCGRGGGRAVSEPRLDTLHSRLNVSLGLLCPFLEGSGPLFGAGTLSLLSAGASLSSSLRLSKGPAPRWRRACSVRVSCGAGPDSRWVRV